MTTVTVEDVMAAAETLSLDERRTLNRMLYDNIKAESDQLGRQKAATFKVGDQVTFLGRKRGFLIKGRIVGFTNKNVRVDSMQDKYGYPTGHVIHWTVSPGLLTKVDSTLDRGEKLGALGSL